MAMLSHPLTVTFTDEAAATLRELMRRTGRDATVLLGEALALERKVVDVTEGGGRVLVERGGRRREVRFPGARSAVARKAANAWWLPSSTTSTASSGITVTMTDYDGSHTA